MEDTKELDVVRSDPFVEMVEKLATNQDVDADKLEKLVSIQMTILDRNAETEFNAAFARVQAQLKTIPFDSFNQQTNSGYAKLKAISSAITPIYTAEGFSTSFSQDKSDIEGHIRVKGVLRHSGGHSESGYYVDVPLDDKGIKGSVNKTPTHATGSTFSYGRRYCKCMMFDVATGDDDDGNQGQSTPPPVKYISDKQVSQIRDLLAKIEEMGGVADEETFCKWAKINSIAEMPEHKFARCLKELTARIDD